MKRLKIFIGIIVGILCGSTSFAMSSHENASCYIVNTSQPKVQLFSANFVETRTTQLLDKQLIAKSCQECHNSTEKLQSQLRLVGQASCVNAEVSQLPFLTHCVAPFPIANVFSNTQLKSTHGLLATKKQQAKIDAKKQLVSFQAKYKSNTDGTIQHRQYFAPKTYDAALISLINTPTVFSSLRSIRHHNTVLFRYLPAQDIQNWSAALEKTFPITTKILPKLPKSLEKLISNNAKYSSLFSSSTDFSGIICVGTKE